MESGGGIGKRLRLRISRVLPSFNSGRPKDQPSAAPVAPPVFCLSPHNPKALDIDFPPPRAATPLRLAPVVTTGCCCNPRRLSRCTPSPSDLSRPRETPTYLWRKDPNWHVVAATAGDNPPRRKIDTDGSSGFIFPQRLRRRKEAEARRRRAERNKIIKKSSARSSRSRSSSRARMSTSSADSGWFSSEDEENDEKDVDGDGGEETETLLSSFEADSSDAAMYQHYKRGTCYPSPDTGSPPERVVEVAGEGGKVAESFAVVKRSEDPKEDFRRSMAEMVLEKQIYDEAGLEQLLHCFLSLNSRHHHPAIVAAFADIWDAIFPATPAVMNTYYK